MNDIDKGILCSAIAAACAFLAGCATPALRAATTPDDFIAVTNSSLSRDEVNARELPYWADLERELFYFQNPKTQQSKDDALRPAEAPVAVAKMSRQDAISIWRSQQATAQERQDAARSLVTNGTPMRDVVAVLGTNYNIFRPFSMFRIDLTDTSHPRDLGLMKTCGIMYRFGKESVDLCTTANISADPLDGTLTGIGFSQPIVARTNADDEIDVKIKNVAAKYHTPASAMRFAVSLANTEASRRYDVQPFPEPCGSIVVVSNRWQWEGLAGFGKGTLDAKVSFAIDGTDQKVDLRLLVDER